MSYIDEDFEALCAAIAAARREAATPVRVEPVCGATMGGQDICARPDGHTGLHDWRKS